VNVVLIILLVMLVGSVACAFIVPPFLNKIEPSGRVNVFGIRFLGK
jgi:predicted RND superfamily exporter protein